jgi:hypothetical protein
MPTITKLVETIAENIDIPSSAYEKAEKRYRDLGDWLSSPSSKSSRHSPHIYPQGSFRLGTVVRPIKEKDEYDLDVGCRLRVGITKDTHTQQALKELVGSDLEAYRAARRILEPLEAMHRCWRLKYSDDLVFHVDVVPSIPEDSMVRQQLSESMTRSGLDHALANRVAGMTGAITDDKHARYKILTRDWRISNSEGYALWFEARIKMASSLLHEIAIRAQVAKIDDLPTYRWKSPLQAAVQVLKRHRDVMFASRMDEKPISIIITTLAAKAYHGETTVDSALQGILKSMHEHVQAAAPRIANPVNPAEDFADRWTDPAYKHLRLEQNFWDWLRQARNDLQELASSTNPQQLHERIDKAFRSRIDATVLQSLVAGGSLLQSANTPGGLSFPPKAIVPSKPSGFA